MMEMEAVVFEFSGISSDFLKLLQSDNKEEKTWFEILQMQRNKNY